MGTLIIASIVVFFFTTILTMAGLGAAFIIIPAFYWLGVPLREAMAVALLLNAISMAFASVTNIRHGLVIYKVALPIALSAVILSPLGAYSAQFVSQKVLLWFFASFLVFAGTMMIFYIPKFREQQESLARDIGFGAGIGAVAGYMGGLLGVGGGNFIIPVLVGTGMEPKKASGTTSFVVLFASLAGFLGHSALNHVDWGLLGVSATASVAGALLGANLLYSKLKNKHVKVIIGAVLYVIAIKIIWNLI